VRGLDLRAQRGGRGGERGERGRGVGRRALFPGYEQDLGGGGELGVLGRADGVGLCVPGLLAVGADGADPAAHDGRDEREPAILADGDLADGEGAELAQGVLAVEGVDLVGGVAADEVEDGERAARVGVEPGGGDGDECVAVDEDGVAAEDALGDFFACPELSAHRWLTASAASAGAELVAD
jgi:hypothetical protein